MPERNAISIKVFDNIQYVYIHIYIHPFGPYSVQSVGAAEAVSLAIGHNPGRVATPTQDTS